MHRGSPNRYSNEKSPANRPEHGAPASAICRSYSDQPAELSHSTVKAQESSSMRLNLAELLERWVRNLNYDVNVLSHTCVHSMVGGASTLLVRHTCARRPERHMNAPKRLSCASLGLARLGSCESLPAALSSKASCFRLRWLAYLLVQGAVCCLL